MTSFIQCLNIDSKFIQQIYSPFGNVELTATHDCGTYLPANIECLELPWSTKIIENTHYEYLGGTFGLDEHQNHLEGRVPSTKAIPVRYPPKCAKWPIGELRQNNPNTVSAAITIFNTELAEELKPGRNNSKRVKIITTIKTFHWSYLNWCWSCCLSSCLNSCLSCYCWILWYYAHLCIWL